MPFSARLEEGDEEDVAALVEKLRSPMNAQSQELKQYMIETILPVVKRVKDVHEALEDKGLSCIARLNPSQHASIA